MFPDLLHLRVFGFGEAYTKECSDAQLFTLMDKYKEIKCGNGYIRHFVGLLILDGHQQHAAPKKAKRDSDAAETVSWTDDEVELLLGAARLYSFQKDYEGLEWESVKSKYEDIRRKSIQIRWNNCLHYKTLRIEQLSDTKYSLWIWPDSKSLETPPNRDVFVSDSLICV